jgi:hypothetical protein
LPPASVQEGAHIPDASWFVTQQIALQTMTEQIEFQKFALSGLISFAFGNALQATSEESGENILRCYEVGRRQSLASGQ